MQKKYKRRNYKKKATKGAKSTFRAGRSYGVKPDPFPPRLKTRVKYTKTQVMSSNVTAGLAGVEQVHRLNSIYDPDHTLGGTTVVGWNIFDSIYSNYIVTGCKVECEFYDPNQDGVITYCSLNQAAQLQNATQDAIVEQFLTYTNVINNTGSQKKSFHFYVKPWALLGLTKLEWDANKSTHSAALAADPTSPVYFKTAITGPNTGGTTSTCNVSLRLIMFVEFFNRKQLLSS